MNRQPSSAGGRCLRPAGAGELLGAGFGFGVLWLSGLHVLAALLDLLLPSTGSRAAQAATAAAAAGLLAAVGSWHHRWACRRGWCRTPPGRS